MTDSNAKRCLALCPLFEAELLLHLMLRNWNHPYAENESFRQVLLESATELLMAASDQDCTEVFIDELPSNEMNFVAAVWYSEWSGVQDDTNEQAGRRDWLSKIRAEIPSCFCKTDNLGP